MDQLVVEEPVSRSDPWDTDMVAERDEAAARLGAERRRLFLASTLLALAVEIAPYLTGSWESAWYALATTSWPIAVRTLLFLAGFFVMLSLVMLPLSYYSGFVLPHAFGLSRQSVRGWAADWLKGVSLSAFVGALAGGAFIWLEATLGSPGWVLAYGALLSGTIVLITFITPYVLVPLFFKTRPLTDKATVERIRALLHRAGCEVREICSLDFSRRTAEANAAVIGIGRSRRVVLADTLLGAFTAPEVDAVVAHEVGHHVSGHLPLLIVAQLALSWVGLALGAWLAPAALPLLSLPSLHYVPGFPVLVAVVSVFSLLVMPLANWWSRRLESAADRFALALTKDPDAFANAMRRLARQNLIELCPPHWAEVLLASHPAVAKRIALAKGWTA